MYKLISDPTCYECGVKIIHKKDDTSWEYFGFCSPDCYLKWSLHHNIDKEMFLKAIYDIKNSVSMDIKKIVKKILQEIRPALVSDCFYKQISMRIQQCIENELKNGTN